MNESVEALRKEMMERMERSTTEEEIEQLRLTYLGRKGKLTQELRTLKDLPLEERPRVGEQLNQLRQELGNWIEARSQQSKARENERVLREDRTDITLPGSRLERGHIHPITLVLDEVIDVFSAMGFEIARGPDIEDDYHNFEALNIPKDHPARDMQDTFFVSDNLLLRTHTSPVQIHVMEERKPPLQIIVPGAVYRHDDDSTHSPIFHQVEGFMVDEQITFGDLKGVLEHFLRQIFRAETPVRFRPSFFPFTEPSAEVDIGCLFCSGKGVSSKGEGCRVCKGTGWLEILGSGMIDPAVFKFVKYDSEKFSGFAFGLGIERIAMLKYAIDDIRLFYQNDIRLLQQFC
jgi:phenylalanyl-tRNA synthetase alpha chain